jgi:hypothetical protein
MEAFDEISSGGIFIGHPLWLHELSARKGLANRFPDMFGQHRATCAPVWGICEPVDDPVLLGKSLGKHGKGNLRQGRVYKSKKGSDVVVFRTWNNTHPGSKLGNWWTFEKPAGKISTYRSEYAICVEWSPIDMLVRCSLRPEQKIVVGTGQSAKCKHMTFPVSDAQQIFIDDAGTVLTDYTVYDGEFNWK